MRVDNQQLKAFILDAELASKEDIEKAEKEAKKKNIPFQQALTEKGIISEDRLRKLKAYILGIPFVNLEKEIIQPDILRIIPEPIAKKHNIVAFKKTGNDLEVAMLDPEDLQTVEFIKKTAGLRILPRLTSPESIKHALRQYQKSLEEEFGKIIKEQTEGIKVIKPEEFEEEGKELEKVAEELPIIRIVDTLIRHAIIQQASDIHIEPLEKEVLVRYRIDGILHDAMVLPKKVNHGIVARIKVLANLKLDEHRLPQDGRFKMETGDYKYSLRVSVLPVFDGEKIVMRLLKEDTKAMTLESLGLRDKAVNLIHLQIKKPNGMILVTGPTGSGKTTTLYTMMDILNSTQVNISTIEDPIEYRIPRINQTQVKPKIGFTFATGLRSLVRQDPDIIMVGEIRDNETASLAINAALTGHLVLSTLHTNSAAGALPRLIDMRAEPFLIASTVNLIIAQRLVRRLCSDVERYKLSKSDINTLSKSIDTDKMLSILIKERVVKPKAKWQDIYFFKPKKSKSCPDGYKGRVGIYEVMLIDDNIKSLITKRATSMEVEEAAKEQGMYTMLEDGFIKAAQGVTSIEEVLRVTRE